MPKVIISYRRQDSQDIAGRIRDRLAADFGDQSVFMDIDNIPLGVDFRDHIQKALNEGDVLIAVVGPRWLGPLGSARGKRLRINDPKDPVRVEIEAALQKKLKIVPALVNGATMPQPDELPETIQDFSYLNAVTLDTGQDFHHHMSRLSRGIRGESDQPAALLSAPVPSAPVASWSHKRRGLAWGAGAAAAAALAGAVLLGYAHWWEPKSSPPVVAGSGEVPKPKAIGATLIPPPGFPTDRPWPAPSPRSYWEAEKSLLYLEATGQARELIFDQPTQQLKDAGARPGDLLFEGRRVGDTYEGRAYLYTGGCGTTDRRIAYDVTGSVVQDLTVEWSGQVPVIDLETCKHKRAIDDQLLFETKKTVVKFKITK